MSASVTMALGALTGGGSAADATGAAAPRGHDAGRRDGGEQEHEERTLRPGGRRRPTRASAHGRSLSLVPGLSVRGSISGLSSSICDSGTPVFSAMDEAVSPDLTV